ncbi:hypothetical protein FE782_11655 [Paenibacillus antri]|uniref:SLH domain-containing protein n=1 Tax=Paenibacillus antri TaxID=2582848 RepID=A0A5R9GCH7_9BACL|nr:S-layer homology domain-containing protein [Paenibacillus antri]TLS52026.1 hypothetical protein FE782_11655 [Paenibacillus antri]
MAIRKMLLSFCLLLASATIASGSVGAAASEPARFTMGVSAERLAPGGTVTVSVGVQGGEDVQGFSASLAYDADRLEVVDATLRSEFGTVGSNASFLQFDAGGELRVVAVRLGKSEGVSGDVPLFTVRLKAKSGSGEARVRLTAGASYSDSDSTLFQSDAEVGRTITVASGTAPGPGGPAPGAGGAPGGPGGGALPPAGLETGGQDAAASVMVDKDWFAEQRKAGETITVRVPEAESRLEVRLPLGALSSGSDRGNVYVVSPLGSYRLPLSLLSTFGVGAGADTELILSMEAVEADKDLSMREAADGIGASLLTGGVQFQVAVASGGITTPVADFGNEYVERSLPLPSGEIDANAVGVWYDEATASYRFVPTRFDREGGTTTATLRRPGNSVYAVASMSKSFEDLTNHWAKADIELLASKFILKGMSASTFEPEASVTRAQFAAMLMQALSLSEAPAHAAFSDVRPGDWHAGAVGAAAKAVLIAGYADGTFQPDRTITRQEMAVIVSRALAFVDKPAPESGPTLRYSDAAGIPEWASGAVAEASSAGIMSAVAADRFGGEQSTTRAQAAVVLKRMLQWVDFL